MRCFLLVPVVLTPLIGAAQEPGPFVTPREQFNALLKQYPGKELAYINNRPKAKEASAQFIKLAREYSADPVAFEALNWVVTRSLFTPMAGEGMDLLRIGHINDPRLAATIRQLEQFQGESFEPFERLIRTAMASSKYHTIKGQATLALARYLWKGKNRILWQRTIHELATLDGKGPYWPRPAESDADLDRMAREADMLFHQAIDHYGDLDGIAQEARHDLNELHHLSIGMVAPEIDGTDIDGKRFKLSDYRGKVVFLYFWNHERCRDLNPAMLRRVERRKDKPFAMLGINSDDEPATLRKLVDQGEVTWRFWCDGDSSQGPIVNQWNVNGNGGSSTFVLDAQGVIRYRKLLFDHLDTAIDVLIKKAQVDRVLRKSK